MSMIAVVENQVLQITYEPPRSKFERELKNYLIGLANLNGIAERTAMRQIPYRHNFVYPAWKIPAL